VCQEVPFVEEAFTTLVTLQMLGFVFMTCLLVCSHMRFVQECFVTHVTLMAIYTTVDIHVSL
jgi:hypothetical protein